MNKERGQVTIEFIITAMIILAMFFAGLYIYQTRQDVNIASVTLWNAESVAQKVAKHINDAYILGSGSAITDEINWSLPSRSIAFSGHSVKAFDGQVYGESPVITADVVFNISQPNGKIVFRNVNGVVHVGSG